jgi:group II intron reverse transcriptase/maturase
LIEGKSFRITQKEILVAYKVVKANRGAGGIDGVSFEDFEKDFKNNMYKLWNRMASGSYFPRAVRGVEIPKKNGKVRLLGIPTINDRIAQMVVRNRFEPKVEKIFLKNSYGYRPNKSALDAVGKARERCFKMPWLIEFDIVGLFDNINHDKLMKAVKMHATEKWINLYIERFLKTSIEMPNRMIQKREAGTPQGGVISPVLANLYMHYAFDKWIQREFPRNPWERYADDGVIHCLSEKQALYIVDRLSRRMKECNLEIHPDKSRIVYCRSGNFREHYKNESFDFLGYTFRSRCCKSRTGQYFTGFTPAVGKEAGKKFRSKIRKTIVRTGTTSIKILAEVLNPIIRGWMNYFLKYNPSEAFKQGINYVNLTLARWLRRTHKKVKNGIYKSQVLLNRIAKEKLDLFYHWSVGYMPVT